MHTVIENDEEPVYPGVARKQHHLTEKMHFPVETKTLQKSVGMILTQKHQSYKTFQVCFLDIQHVDSDM